MRDRDVHIRASESINVHNHEGVVCPKIIPWENVRGVAERWMEEEKEIPDIIAVPPTVGTCRMLLEIPGPKTKNQFLVLVICFWCYLCSGTNFPESLAHPHLLILSGLRQCLPRHHT